MDKYRKHNYTNPSFSSTLLDQIYRSIDESSDHRVADDDELGLYRETATVKKKKQNVHATSDAKNVQKIEKWMEKKMARENIVKNREKSVHKIYQRENDKTFGDFMNLNSSWSSSDSSSGGLFSSEADSNYGISSRSSSAANMAKPIRTNTVINKTAHPEKLNQDSDSTIKRSKLKALKIYRDLKNVKQPISPGAKLANFLNSLFTTGGNAKKGNFSGAMSSTTSPACSTSKSCLSKTPSTRGKLSDTGTKRSVQFNPVSVVMGHGQCRADQRNCVNEELMYHIRMKNQSVGKAAREFSKNYESEEDEDDDASYASSDLFELDCLNNCGINVRGDYMEELPVYETTYLGTILGS